MNQASATIGVLSWLAHNDPNGLWGEYVADYSAACKEHGDVSYADALAEKNEQIREGS